MECERADTVVIALSLPADYIWHVAPIKGPLCKRGSPVVTYVDRVGVDCDLRVEALEGWLLRVRFRRISPVCVFCFNQLRVSLRRDSFVVRFQ